VGGQAACAGMQYAMLRLVWGLCLVDEPRKQNLVRGCFSLTLSQTRGWQPLAQHSLMLSSAVASIRQTCVPMFDSLLESAPAGAALALVGGLSTTCPALVIKIVREVLRVWVQCAALLQVYTCLYT
jgi:hypothetical protein